MVPAFRKVIILVREVRRAREKTSMEKQGGSQGQRLKALLQHFLELNQADKLIHNSVSISSQYNFLEKQVLLVHYPGHQVRFHLPNISLVTPLGRMQDWGPSSPEGLGVL